MEYEIDIEKDNDSDILVSVVEGEGHIDVMSDDYHRIDVINESAAVSPQVKDFLEHANSLTDIYFGANKIWNVLPHASATVLGGVKIGSNLTIDVNGVLNGAPGTGGGVWNEIGGDISTQADLMAMFALYAPIDNPTFTTGIITPALKVTIGAALGNILISDADGDLSYLTAGATTKILVGGGAANPVWTEATGTGAPVREGSPRFSGNVAIGFSTPLSTLCINGGLHVGGESAAGTDNLLVDGATTLGGSLTFIGAQSITNTTGILTLAPTADLDLTPGGTARVRTTSGVRLQSDNYASQLTGWGISYTGVGDFRYLYADEVHAKSFIADLEQALAGGQIISKSVAPLASIFMVPAAGATATLVVESFKGFDSFKVFVDGDIVRLRQFDRTGTSLNIVNCWGTVVWVSTDTTNKTQTYTFTRSSGGNAGTATTSSTIAAGVLVLDYGTTGNGLLESNAIDGAMAENAPYHQIVSWTTHPATGQIVRTRLGNLKGIFNVTNEYGLYAGSGITDASQYLRISDQVIEAHNLTIKLYDGAVNTVLLSPTTPSFAMGSTLPTGYMTGSGIWMGKDSTAYKMRVGSVSGGVLTGGFSWDGTIFSIVGIATIGTTAIGGESVRITGGSFDNVTSTSNDSALYFNDTSTGGAYYRDFIVGDGKSWPNGILIYCDGSTNRVGITCNSWSEIDSTFTVNIRNGAGLKINYNSTGVNYLYGALTADSIISAAGIRTTGGVHVGGTSDPGTDNLLVDGNITTSTLNVTGVATFNTLATLNVTGAATLNAGFSVGNAASSTFNNHGYDSKGYSLRSGAYTSSGTSRQILVLNIAYGTLRIIATDNGANSTIREYRVGNTSNYPANYEIVGTGSVSRGTVPGFNVATAGASGLMAIFITVGAGYIVNWSFEGVTTDNTLYEN